MNTKFYFWHKTPSSKRTQTRFPESEVSRATPVNRALPTSSFDSVMRLCPTIGEIAAQLKTGGKICNTDHFLWQHLLRSPTPPNSPTPDNHQT